MARCTRAIPPWPIAIASVAAQILLERSVRSGASALNFCLIVSTSTPHRTELRGFNQLFIHATLAQQELRSCCARAHGGWGPPKKAMAGGDRAGA